MQPDAVAQWPPIDLAWRQRVAAFWSIAWPAWLASYLILFVIPDRYSNDELVRLVPILSLVAAAVFLLGQAVLIQRLVQKQYRSFRVIVLRDGIPSSPKLSLPEATQVWIRVLWPQIAFLALTVLLKLLSGSLNSQTARALDSLAFLLRFLVIGPFGIRSALKADYPEFRLQAFGQRLI